MNYAFLLGLAFVIFTPIVYAWDCPAHLIVMQIAMKELTSDERTKVETILGWMTSKDAQFSVLESACFHEDMTASGFTAFDLWKSYETPFYQDISEQDAKFSIPLMDSLAGIVTILLDIVLIFIISK